MSIGAMIVVLGIYITPCNIPHPEHMTCREYKVHLAAESQLITDMDVQLETLSLEE